MSYNNIGERFVGLGGESEGEPDVVNKLIEVLGIEKFDGREGDDVSMDFLVRGFEHYFRDRGLSFDELKKFVGDQLLRFLIYMETQNTQPLTRGQEGEVYKIHTGNRDFLVIKKREVEGGENEFINHKGIYDLSEKNGTSVKIPKPFDFFWDEETRSEFIIMDYIDGKTLYTMAWEEIINKHLIRRVQKAFENPQLSRDPNISSLKEDFDNLPRHGKKISLENDTETFWTMKTICSILNVLGDLDGEFDSYEKDPQDPTRVKYPIEEKLYNQYISKISLFSEEDERRFKQEITNFLKTIHSYGYYHRDLGKNTRNIMFRRNAEEQSYEIYIIDFGRSIKLESGVVYDYKNPNGWDYTKDEDVLARISEASKISEEDDRKLKEQEELENTDFDKIIEKAQDLGIKISESFIKNNMSLFKNFSKTPVKILEDFIYKRDEKYSWFISLKPKDDEQSEETQKGHKYLFVILSVLDDPEKEDLEKEINQYLKENKNSRKYKYAKLFSNYLQKIKE